MSAVKTPPEARTHADYVEGDTWTVADIEDVDRLFTTATDDGKVRIDLDGRAAASAEIADYGEPVNVSVWLDAEQQEQLVDALEEANR